MSGEYRMYLVVPENYSDMREGDKKDWHHRGYPKIVSDSIHGIPAALEQAALTFPDTKFEAWVKHSYAGGVKVIMNKGKYGE